MNFLGIPFFITYQYYLDFLSNNFSNYSQYSIFIESNLVIPVYILCNAIYLFFMFRVVIPFIYKVICYILNLFD